MRPVVLIIVMRLNPNATSSVTTKIKPKPKADLNWETGHKHSNIATQPIIRFAEARGTEKRRDVRAEERKVALGTE